MRGLNPLLIRVIRSALFTFVIWLIPYSGYSLTYLDFTYTANPIDNTVTITQYTGATRELAIPAMIDGMPVIVIGNGAFRGNTKLRSVIIPDSVLTIEDYAFSECSRLASISIPTNNITVLNRHVFSYCTGLTSIDIPSGITTIKYNVFRGCTSLESVTIPDSVRTIEEYSFAYCSELSDFNVGDTNPHFSLIDGVLFTKNRETLKVYPPGRQGSYSIPYGTQRIYGGAFHSCNGLTSITIPDSTTLIGGAAFSSCNGLTTLNIPNSVVYIGLWAFDHCDNLATVTLPNGITAIELGLFDSCIGLKNITIPESVTSIEPHAFRNCTSLSHITIPDSVTTIKDYAFSDCSTLARVTLSHRTSNIGQWVFRNCGMLADIYCRGNPPSMFNNAVIGINEQAIFYYLEEAVGWGPTYKGFPTVLWNPEIQTGDADFGMTPVGFRFNIFATNNFTVVIEACTNLPTGGWQPVETVTLVDGIYSFIDSEGLNFSSRYYRLQTP